MYDDDKIWEALSKGSVDPDYSSTSYYTFSPLHGSTVVSDSLPSGCPELVRSCSVGPRRRLSFSRSVSDRRESCDLDVEGSPCCAPPPSPRSPGAAVPRVSAELLKGLPHTVQLPGTTRVCTAIERHCLDAVIDLLQATRDAIIASNAHTIVCAKPVNPK